MSNDMHPTMIVIAGPNGSGKTLFTTEILSHKWLENCFYINPDEIALKQYGDWNSTEAIIKAAQQAQIEREKYLIEKQNFAFETVLSSPEKLDFLKRAAKAGFFIRLFFISTSSPIINASRVAQRVMHGGHDVPIIKIVSRYAKSIANCAACASFVDRSYIYDNSEEGKLPRLLFRSRNGEIVKIYGELPVWAKKIQDSIDTLKHPSKKE